VNVPTPAQGHAIRPFDNAALYAALNEKRTALGLSWQRVAEQMWEQSAALNERRLDHPISPSTLTNVSRSQRTSCQHALFMLRWLGRTPESFLRGAAGTDERFNLPAADQDHRLRWALKLLYVALDEKRRQDGLSWISLAAVLGCSPSQLTGLRTAKYATTTDLAMRITQWLGRPAADFVYPAAWLAVCVANLGLMMTTASGETELPGAGLVGEANRPVETNRDGVPGVAPWTNDADGSSILPGGHERGEGDAAAEAATPVGAGAADRFDQGDISAPPHRAGGGHLAGAFRHGNPVEAGVVVRGLHQPLVHLLAHP
jgi:hypothetical protein